MSKPDLNLLYTLEALLAEGSVAGAARRLQLSPSAMSRALARLRDTMGDPLLVRAGRKLVPTPRAVELSAIIAELAQTAQAMLRPAEALDLKLVTRTFTIRTSDGFVENFAPALLARIRQDAPDVKLRFVQKIDRESTGLRNGTIDLETGVIGTITSPEIRTQALFADRFVGAVRSGHFFERQPVTLDAYLAGHHVEFARRNEAGGPIEEALASFGKMRDIEVAVSGFSAALALAKGTDLIATIPERHTTALRAGMHTFALPFDIPAFTVSLLWHPRMDADPAHRWIRQCLKDICREHIAEDELRRMEK